MITSTSQPEKYLARFSDGAHEALSDTTPQYGGASAGFKPMTLLEAALANCITIVLRMAADKKGIPLAGVNATVTLKTDDPAQTVFEYSIELLGELTDEQRSFLLRAANACPVKKALAKPVVFQEKA